MKPEWLRKSLWAWVWAAMPLAGLRAGELSGAAPFVPAPEGKPSGGGGLLNDAWRVKSPAFEEWDIGGQVRFRYERKDDAGTFADSDFVRGAGNDNDFLLFREKVHIGWRPESWLQFYVEGRGAQAEGDIRNSDPEHDVWDLHQAYVRVGDAKRFPLELQAGRQEMNYGDQRFIGAGDWGNTGRSFDAVRLRYYISDKSRIDLFTARVVIPGDGNFNESNEDDPFSGMYASSKEVWEGVETQAYFLARNTGGGSPNAIAPGIGGPSERDVYTYGLRLKSLPGAFGGWNFGLEGAGQFGEIVSGGAVRDLRAYAFAATAGYSFQDAPGTPGIAVGYDYASGDSDANDSRHETFEPLFGTNHGFYGVMDLIGLRNLQSPRIAVSIKPTPKLSLSADWLVFWLADKADSFYPESGSGRSRNGYGRNAEFGSYVGSELDLVGRYAFTQWAGIHMGYGHFFPGEYIRKSVSSVSGNRGVTDADWFYVQAVVHF